MSLSYQEIERLIEKAESCLKSSFNSEKFKDKVRFQVEALNCFDQIIENAADHDYYFAKRSDIKHMLAYSSGKYESYLNGSIDDMSRAIELNPGKGDWYRLRGQFLLAYVTALKEVISDARLNQLLGNAIADFQACLNKDPTKPELWLSLMGVNLILRNFDEVLGIYGQCEVYVKSKEDRLIRSWLCCLALTIAGDTIGDKDISPLYDQTIRPEFDSLIDIFNSFFGKIYKQENSEDKLTRLKEIQKLFIAHFDSWNAKAGLFKDNGFYEEALEAYEKATEKNPNDDGAWFNKGLLLRNILNRDEEALKAFTKTLELNPLFMKAWQKKCDTLSSLGRNEEARQAFEIAENLRSVEEK